MSLEVASLTGQKTNVRRPRIALYENEDLKTPKPLFVLESLSFKNHISRDLDNGTVKANSFNNGANDVDILSSTKTENLENYLSSPVAAKFLLTENTSPCDNRTILNLLEDENVPSGRFSRAVLIPQPHFILESLSFPKKVNSDGIVSNLLVSTDKSDFCNAQKSDVSCFTKKSPRLLHNCNIQNNSTIVSAQDSSNVQFGLSLYSQISEPVKKPFFVLESLSYNESGILRVTSRNTSEGKSYDILQSSHTILSKQTNDADKTVRKVNKSSTNIYKTEREKPNIKYQSIRKGPYLNFSDYKNKSTCRSNLSRMVQYKHTILNNRKQSETLNRCLLLEMDPVHSEILKTVRQPYVILEKLPDFS